PQARGNRLGKSAEINDVADGVAGITPQVLAVDHDQWRNVLALIEQLSVRIIFYYWHPIFIREQHQFVTAAFTQRGSRGILKVGQQIHEFGIGAQRLFDEVGANSLGIDRYREIFRPVGIECLQGTEIRRRLDEHTIAAVDEQLPN